jgi:hypothetical protein
LVWVIWTIKTAHSQVLYFVRMNVKSRKTA